MKILQTSLIAAFVAFTAVSAANAQAKRVFVNYDHQTFIEQTAPSSRAAQEKLTW